MTIKNTLSDLENALGTIEFHTEYLKKAIAIAKQIKSANVEGECTDAEETFSDEAGYGARRFVSTFENCGDFEVDFLFKILNAVEEYEKSKK